MAKLPVGRYKYWQQSLTSRIIRPEKLAVKLDDGILYQTEDNLVEQKGTDKCMIVIWKRKLLPTRKTSTVCKIVKKKDWAGVLDYQKEGLRP